MFTEWELVLNKIIELNYVAKLITVCGSRARNLDVLTNTTQLQQNPILMLKRSIEIKCYGLVGYTN
jgi:hypothetical protein